MTALTSDQLARACRLFLTLAYPAGAESIPEKRRAYVGIAPDADLGDYLPSGSRAQGIGQVLKNEDGSLRGYTFRLGCAHFPHLKLQVTDHNDGCVCVFAVDTHDALPPTGVLPPDHPDFAAWTVLREQNQRLKEEIEGAWDQAGLWTFHRLLREDLKGDRGT